MKESRKSCSCSSLVLFLVIAPLILVSILVLSNSNSHSSSPWPWSSASPSSVTSNTTTAAEARGRHGSNFTKILGVHQNKEEALSDVHAVTLNISSLPLTISASHIQKHDVGKPNELMSLADEYDFTLVRRRVHKRFSKLDKLELGLARARATIREAAKNENQTTQHYYIQRGPMYWNANTFQRSYFEMEKRFKIFIYEEGEPPLFHNGPCKSIYSMEGNFIHELEIDPRFRVRDPDKAHVFFLPFSVSMMVQFIYVSESHDTNPIKHTISDYVSVIAKKYPYWNRSLGADHFMLSCHDWGPLASSFVPFLFSNSIRVLCNANTSEGFNPSKDASFPEINLQTGDIKGLIGGPSPSRRPILAFFAGGLHGPIRPALLKHWKDVDDEIQIHEYLPKGMLYYDMMKKSKYCICPSGYEVASPRIVEAIYTGCVPVLISDHYVPPFSDVLNWKSFSVVISSQDIPKLKRILTRISQSQYIRMQRRGVQARKHFEVNSPPKRFDVFHMILHSIWLRRLNIRVRDRLF